MRKYRVQFIEEYASDGIMFLEAASSDDASDIANEVIAKFEEGSFSIDTKSGDHLYRTGVTLMHVEDVTHNETRSD